MATLVLSLGNVLMADDGLGPAVLRAFDERYVAGPDAEVLDLGTPGLDLSVWLADADRIILVDTVHAPLPPGSLRVYSKAELIAHAPGTRISPHDPGLRETLLALEFAGRAPREVTLIGVVPAKTTMGLALTPVVAAAIPAAVEEIVAALERTGITVQCRPRPSMLEPWWKIPTLGKSSAPFAAGNPSHAEGTPANS